MCAKCDQYADEREAAQEPDEAAPKHEYIANDTGPTNTKRCEGCGERIGYLELYRYDNEADQYWHEGCEREPGDGFCACGERLDVPHQHGGE